MGYGRGKSYGGRKPLPILRKKFSRSWTSLIKVEGLFSPYIVTHFDIVNSESLV